MLIFTIINNIDSSIEAINKFIENGLYEGTIELIKQIIEEYPYDYRYNSPIQRAIPTTRRIRNEQFANPTAPPRAKEIQSLFQPKCFEDYFMYFDLLRNCRYGDCRARIDEISPWYNAEPAKRRRKFL